MTTQTIQTIAEQIAAEFNFTVDKLPLAGPDNLKTPFYGLFRSDTGKVVHSASVTSRYEPHTVDDVTALVEAATTVFDGEHHLECHFRNGHYVTVQPDMKHRKEIRENDGVFPRLIISAGYDGKSFEAALGIFRDTCDNMMMIRSVRQTRLSIRHTPILRSHMDALIAGFAEFHDGWDNLVETIRDMEAVVVDFPALLDSLYPTPSEDAPQRKVTIHNDRRDLINARLRDEMAKTRRVGDTVTGWMAFNAIQGYVQHEASRSKKSTKFDRILAAANDPIVKKAEKLILGK
jgi:hypothetical protein